MTTPAETQYHERVAALVRGECAKVRINTRSLPTLLGGSNSTWSRKLRGDTPLTLNDLADLAQLLNVPVTTFIPSTVDVVVLPRLDSNQQPAGYLAVMQPGSLSKVGLNQPPRPVETYRKMRV